MISNKSGEQAGERSPERRLVASELQHSTRRSSNSTMKIRLNSTPIQSTTDIEHVSVNVDKPASEEKKSASPIQQPNSTLIQAKKSLKDANIYISNNLQAALERDQVNAAVIAQALIYLHKSNLMLTAENIFDIANAGARAQEVAVNTICFASLVTCDMQLISALIQTLIHTDNVSATVNLVAMISCMIPITQHLIFAIASAQDKQNFLETMLSLKERSIPLNEENLIAIALVNATLRTTLTNNLKIVIPLIHELLYTKNAALIVNTIVNAELLPHLYEAVLSLKEDNIPLTKESLLALALADVAVRNALASNIRVASDFGCKKYTSVQVQKAVIMKGLLENSLLSSPKKVVEKAVDSSLKQANSRKLGG